MLHTEADVSDAAPQDLATGPAVTAEYNSLTAMFDKSTPVRPVLTSRQHRPVGMGLAERVVELDLCKDDTSPGPSGSRGTTPASSMAGISG